jgi:hypothetical protein
LYYLLSQSISLRHYFDGLASNSIQNSLKDSLSLNPISCDESRFPAGGVLAGGVLVGVSCNAKRGPVLGSLAGGDLAGGVLVWISCDESRFPAGGVLVGVSCNAKRGPVLGSLAGGVLAGGVFAGGVLAGGVLAGGVFAGGVLAGGVLAGGVVVITRLFMYKYPPTSKSNTKKIVIQTPTDMVRFLYRFLCAYRICGGFILGIGFIKKIICIYRFFFHI